jgi:hypothetical protein
VGSPGLVEFITGYCRKKIFCGLDYTFDHIGVDSRRYIQEFLNGRRDVLRFSRWGETIMDLSGLLDKKFGEVPFDGF